jgi:hypothetical protein
MWIVAVFLWVVLYSGTAAAFECAGMTLPSTLVICSDPELMRLADERQEAINEARGRIGEEAWPVLWENLCANGDLSRLDLRFGQAYWALFQQLGPAGQSQLKEEDLTFFDQVQGKCEIPRSGPLTAEAWRSRDCVRDAYEKMREAWLARLTGPAYEEAVRSPEKHVALLVFRFMLHRRAREMGLGPLHIVTLSEAREKARECRKLRHEGVGPDRGPQGQARRGTACRGDCPQFPGMRRALYRSAPRRLEEPEARQAVAKLARCLRLSGVR